MHNHVGYAHLIEALRLCSTPLRRPASIKPVTRLDVIGDCLAVPARLAPAADDLLGHILFAIKNEGINLCLLAQALPQIAADSLLTELAQKPSSAFIRKACFLWEAFTGQQLATELCGRGNAVPLFDPERYVTGPNVRNSRWRIDFNGLGNLYYCASVERTPELQALLQRNILQSANDFIASLPPLMMDRAISWAYLHETRDSYAIERESPSEGKAQRFMQLLRQAHEQRPLTEEYLVSLQNATLSNPYDLAAAFRHQQNHLSNGLRGSAGVSYVPPEPELCRELMEALMAFANGPARQVDPLIAATIISFGFVFLHPFMDGNGRLSRFLIHHSLCQSGALQHGLLLPVSVAMKREEARYLQTLQGFSRPAREFWTVEWQDAEAFSFQFNGHPALYRYWDASDCALFLLEMTQSALEVELRSETEFLGRYDRILAQVNQHYDVRGSLLSKLVMMCLDNGGTLSLNRRKQFRYEAAPEVFDCIETLTRQELGIADTGSTPD